MKLHFHLIEKIVLALDEIFLDGRYADKVVDKLLKSSRQLGSRDRRFIAETLYDVVRNYRFYAEVMKSKESFDLVIAHLIKTRGELPKLEEFDEFDVEKIKSRLKYKFDDQVQYSYPDWLHELGTTEFGTEWPALMKSLNQQAEVFLRANRLKQTKEIVQAELLKEEIETEFITGYEDCLKLKERKNVFVTHAYKSGFFEVQDAASQMIAPLLNVEPGMRVVDACAGAGGKSLHIAAKMKNKGKIISMDIHEWKLGELKKRAARNGVDIVETKLIDSTKVIKRFENSFDRVLLDVPCSGLGVLRRNPDTKWKLTLKEIDHLVELQQQILTDYSKMCKVGGLMVYATCSILRREDEEQVQKFMNSENGKKWSLIQEIRTWPHKEGFDGFYAAVLKRES